MERGRANLIKYADICYIPIICFVKHKLCYGNIASPVDAIICTSVSPAAALFAPRPSFGSPAERTQDVWSVQLPLALIIAYVEHKPKSARLSISNMSKPNKIIGNMSYQLPSVHLPMLKLFTGTSPFTIASIREAAINVHWVSYVLIIHGFIFI
nr:hypothetical protein Iba_chr10cCG12040 [Ipomoea batatas]